MREYYEDAYRDEDEGILTRNEDLIMEVFRIPDIKKGFGLILSTSSTTPIIDITIDLHDELISLVVKGFLRERRLGKLGAYFLTSKGDTYITSKKPAYATQEKHDGHIM